MAYGSKYYGEFYDREDNLYKVDLQKDGYGGAATRIVQMGATPCTMSHRGSRDKDVIIQGTNLIFNFYELSGDDYSDLFTSSYKDYKIIYTKAGSKIFEGYIKPENLSKQHFKTKKLISLPATDALADLKNIDFTDSINATISSRETILQILKYALDKTGIELNFHIQLGTYEETYMVASECAIKEIEVDCRRFLKQDGDKTEIMSCHEVIETVLKDYNVTLKQCNGKYYITNHFEEDSYYFEYLWSDLSIIGSRTATDNIVNLNTYKFKPTAEIQQIEPLNKVKINHRNKDLGGDVTGMDLTDWSNGAVWTIDFSNSYTSASGVVTLKSNNNAYDEFIETATFNVSDTAGVDEYLKITFDHILDAHTSPDPLKAPVIKLTITRPDATTEDTYFVIEKNWNSYESPISKSLQVISTGNYEVKLSFLQAAGPTQWTTAEFKIKNFLISKVINNEEGEALSSITFDQYYEQTSSQGIKVFETETLLADCGQITELGALLYDNAGTIVNTATWKTYGGAEGIAILDIYARNILNNRYAYKDYLRLDIFDLGNIINFNNIVSIDSINYTFISFSQDFKKGVINAELEELITTKESYNDISQSDLNSINGEKATRSININPSTPSSIPAHNSLTGLNAGDYQHLTAAQDTDLTDSGNCSIHKHDDRYYTETEVNTWRNSVTQEQMGWLNTISSNVQAQITARAIIGANPANNRLCTWSNATTIQGESNLTFDGSNLLVTGTLTLTSHLYQGDGDIHFFGADNDTGILHTGTNFYIKSYLHGGAIYIQGENTGGDSKNLIYADPDGVTNLYHAGNIKLATSATGITVTGGTIENQAEHPSFSSGFQGDKWQITEDGNSEWENVLIRGGLQVYELIINRLHYQCGGLIIGAGAGKINTIHVATVGSEQLEFEDPVGNSILPFTVGAIVMIQDVDVNRTTVVKKIVRQVASIAGQVLTLTTTAGWLTTDDTGIFAVGDEVVAIGHVSTAALDSSIYLSATDSDNPFMRVFDGVDTYGKWSLGDKTTIKLQLGNLASLASYDILPASPGYGLYSDNVYLKGKIVASSGEIGGWTISATALTGGAAGTTIALTPGIGIHMGAAVFGDAPFSVTNAGVLLAESGTIGGWTLATDAFYTGTKHTANGFSTTGITLASNGAIHAPNFYVDTADEIGLRAETIIKAYKGVSDTVILSHDATVNTINTSWVLKKTITLGSHVKSGRTLRIKFDLWISDGAGTAYGGIWKNGNSVGNEQSTQSVTAVTKSQDIADWDSGDTIQLKIRTSHADYQASADDFRVCGIIASIVDEVTGTNS